MSFESFLTDATNFFKEIPVTASYAAVVSTALAVERFIKGAVGKDFKPSLREIRKGLADFIAPKPTAPAVVVSTAATNVITTSTAEVVAPTAPPVA